MTRDPLVRVSPSADLTCVSVSVQEAFLLSRVDQGTTVEEICLVSGMSEAQTKELIDSLHHRGILLLGDEAPRKIQQHPGAASSSVDNGPMSCTQEIEDSRDVQLSESQKGWDLPDHVRQRILSFHQQMEELDYFELLGIQPTREMKRIRRAYFRRSKEFHPDRYFKKNLGEVQEALLQIFKKIRQAYEFLKDEKPREQYMLRILYERRERMDRDF